LDKYPFSDPLFLKSHNLRSLRGLSGETDLEAPEWTVKKWGSAALFDLAVPTSLPKSGNFSVTIPLHTRYLPPQEVEHVLLAIPFPSVFYACPADNSATKFASSPFDRVDIGYDGLFGGNTLFYHVSPSTGSFDSEETIDQFDASGGMAIATLRVPVLDAEKAEYVGMGTMAAVGVGVLWLVWKLYTGVWAKKESKKTATPKVVKSSASVSGSDGDVSTPKRGGKSRKSAVSKDE
jgi:hypothetical protein